MKLFTYKDFTITVLEMDENHVEKVQILSKAFEYR